MTLSSHFPGLLIHNEAPPDDVAAELSKVVTGPQKELSWIDIEVQKLESQIQTLRLRRIELQESLNPYHAILSPIRRVHRDVLGEIFLRCLPDSRNPTMSASDFPLTLTRVCKMWRETAFSTPALWDRLHIPFTEGRSIPPPSPLPFHFMGDPLEHTKIYPLMKRRCQEIKTWLSRSGNRPLTLSIYHRMTRMQARYVDHSLVDLFFSTLGLFLHRWRDISMIMTPNMFARFDKMVSESRGSAPEVEMPMLQRMFIYYSQDSDVQDTQEYYPILFKASYLKHLKLDSHSIGMAKLFTPAQLSPTLTYLDCSKFPVMNTAVLTLLKGLPGLIHCKLTIQEDYSTRNMVNQDPRRSAFPVSMPHLQSFCILDNGSYPSAKEIYSCLEMPSLQWLVYERDSAFSPNDIHLGQFPPLSFLRNPSNNMVRLKKMTYSQFGYDKEVIHEFLGRSPSITHLVLGDQGHRARRYVNKPLIVRKIQNFDLEDLIVHEGEFDNNSHVALLPNLTVFEAYAIVTLSDEDILRFILSRLNSTSSFKNVVMLEHVKIFFAREKQHDILPTILERAASLGASIKVDLTYDVPKFSRNDYMLSNYYGAEMKENLCESVWMN